MCVESSRECLCMCVWRTVQNVYGGLYRVCVEAVLNVCGGLYRMCVYVCYIILYHFVSYHVTSRHVTSCLVLSCLVLSCLVLSCLVFKTLTTVLQLPTFFSTVTCCKGL